MGTETICEAFDLIRRYAEMRGWIPIGWREFTVGPWSVTVNGTAEDRGNVPPYHAMIAHRDIVAFMVISPFGGTVGGWNQAEDQFIADMERALTSDHAEGER